MSRKERRLQQDLHRLIEEGAIEEFLDLEGTPRYRSNVGEKAQTAGGAA